MRLFRLMQWNANVPTSSDRAINNAQSNRSEIHCDTYPTGFNKSIPRSSHPFRPRNVVENKKCFLSEKGEYLFEVSPCCLFIVVTVNKNVVHWLPTCKNVGQGVLKPPNDYLYSIEAELLKVTPGNICK